MRAKLTSSDVFTLNVALYSACILLKGRRNAFTQYEHLTSTITNATRLRNEIGKSAYSAMPKCSCSVKVQC